MKYYTLQPLSPVKNRLLSPQQEQPLIAVWVADAARLGSLEPQEHVVQCPIYGLHAYWRISSKMFSDMKFHLIAPFEKYCAGTVLFVRITPWHVAILAQMFPQEIFLASYLIYQYMYITSNVKYSGDGEMLSWL